MPTEQQVATVRLFRGIDRELSYLVPDGMSVEVGSMDEVLSIADNSASRAGVTQW